MVVIKARVYGRNGERFVAEFEHSCKPQVGESIYFSGPDDESTKHYYINEISHYPQDQEFDLLMRCSKERPQSPYR